MSETIDVLLISRDETLRDAIAASRPPSRRLCAVSSWSVADCDIGRIRQVWLDLDTPLPQSLPNAEQYIYFFSDRSRASEGLPTGRHIRKPCTSVVFEVLWTDTDHDAMPSARAPEDLRAVPPIPGWTLSLLDLHLPSLCRRLINTLPGRLGYQHASLYLHDERRGLLTLAESTHKRAAVPFSVATGAPQQHLLAWITREDRLIKTDNLRQTLIAEGVPHLARPTGADGACLLAPLRTDGRLVGVLLLADRSPQAPPPVEGALETLMSFVARTLSHARLYDEARVEARVDTLTGLYNLRWITESLEREIRRAERFGSPLSALVVDLDGLKGINDHHGHAAGDCVLRHVASRITGVLRQFDGAARVGGDEFVVMLPATDRAGARHVADRLIHSVRTDVAHYRNAPMPVTASVGAAEWRPGMSASALIEAADRAMYRAKKSGRDQLATSAALGDLPAPPTASTTARFTPEQVPSPRRRG